MRTCARTVPSGVPQGRVPRGRGELRDKPPPDPHGPADPHGTANGTYPPMRCTCRSRVHDRYGYAPAAVSAACAFSARSTPERDSEISRRSAGAGSAEASHASVFARVSASTWTDG